MTAATHTILRPRLIQGYILRECLGLFLVSLLAVSLILFMGRIMRVMQLIITKGVGLAEIGQFCCYMLPYLLVFTVPMAAMIAVLLTFTRLSGDNEIMALKTSGVSLAQLLPPVVLFGLGVAVATLALSMSLTPWGNRQMRQLLVEVTKRRADMGIREQVFNTDFQNLMIFVNHIPPGGGALEGVFISDERDPSLPNTVMAERGRLTFDPASQRLLLQLFQGRVIRISPDQTGLNSVEFETYQIPLDLFQFSLPRPRSEDEMGWGELHRTWQRQTPGTPDYNRMAIELHRRLALPLGGLLLVLLAMPLGITTRSKGRSLGLILGLGSFLLYYVLLTASWRLGLKGIIPPAGAPWLPNLIFLALAAFFWHRARQDRTLDLFEAGSFGLLRLIRRSKADPGSPSRS